MASHDCSMPGLPSWVPDWSQKTQRSYQRKWSSSVLFGSFLKTQSKDDGRFRVHGQTGSLCILAAEIDIMAPYLSRGFQSTTDGTVTVEAGCFKVSLAPEVLRICEPNDRIFRLSDYRFCLIIRKKANPDVYTFIGLCVYSNATNNQQEVDAHKYFLDWTWLLSLGQKEPWAEFSTWTDAQVCWLALRKQKKLESRLFLQRIVRKAQFLQNMSNLVKEAQQALSNDSRDKELLEDFFKRQWKKSYQKWQEEDQKIVVDHQAYSVSIRKCLPGYSRLEPLQDTTQSPLGQSMWLPEKVFEFLFADSETITQPMQSEGRNWEKFVDHGQPYSCGRPLVQGWRQEMESWKVVEQYVSKSEWHMSCIKMYRLRGSKTEEDVYKEIVII